MLLAWIFGRMRLMFALLLYRNAAGHRWILKALNAAKASMEKVESARFVRPASLRTILGFLQRAVPLAHIEDNFQRRIEKARLGDCHAVRLLNGEDHRIRLAAFMVRAPGGLWT